jgi:hypothetical protein
MESRIPIFTNLTITPKENKSLKRYFSSIKRNLPKNWKLLLKSEYKDNDTFKILVDYLCIETHKFKDNIKQQTLNGFIHLGLTDDSIILLKIDFNVEIPKEESIEIVGYILHSFHELVLKLNNHYNSFQHDFKFGGPTDENWYKNDLRDERSIKLRSKADGKTYFLAKNESSNINGKVIDFSAPNNISISLSLMKKSLKTARKIFNKLVVSSSGNKINITEELKPDFYDFFEQIQTSIIFSYIAIEGFSNAVIPDDFQFEKFNEKGIKETWNKENIERWMSTSEKVGNILPSILMTSDIKIERFWTNFKELEKLRNDIVHQKTIKKGTKLDVELFHQMLNPNVIDKITSSIKVIEFFYKIDSAHPYFPLGFGIAKFQVHDIESMEKHFKAFDD